MAMAKERDEEVTTPAAEGEGAPAEPEGAIRVGPEADEDDADGSPAQQPDKPARRQQFGQLKKQAKEWEAKYSKLEQEVAELRGRSQVPAPVIIRDPQRQDQPDPDAAAVKSVISQQSVILRALRTPGLAEVDSQRLQEQWYELDQQRSDLQSEISNKRNSRKQQANQPDVAAEAAQQILRSEFPKVFSNSYYRQLAIAETNRISEERRTPVDISIAREAAQLVYARNGLGGAKAGAPSPEARAKYESTGTRPAAANSGGDTWVPNRMQRKHAMSYSEHLGNLSDEQKLRRWYNEVGRPNKLV